MASNWFQCVSLHEPVWVIVLGLDINAGHIEACPIVADCRPAGAAKQVL